MTTDEQIHLTTTEARGAANFLRGMSFDPSLPEETREACMTKALEIDAALDELQDGESE